MNTTPSKLCTTEPNCAPSTYRFKPKNVLVSSILGLCLTACGGGGGEDSLMVEKPAVLSGTYEIDARMSVDSCNLGKTRLYQLLTVTQAGDQIAGRDFGSNSVSGFVSQSPFGFVVGNVDLNSATYSEQISVTYSESERRFNAVIAVDFVEGGSRCRLEFQGNAKYFAS